MLSLIRNCRKRSCLPRVAQVASIHPSAGLSFPGPSPGEAGRCCSQLALTALLLWGVSGEHDTPRLGPHGSNLTPALTRATTSHCCDWHSVGRPQVASGNLVANRGSPDTCPHAICSRGMEATHLQGVGRRAGKCQPRLLLSQLTQASEEEPPGIAQARLMAGKACLRPGLAFAALRGRHRLHTRPQASRVSSKRSPQGTYRPRRRRVKKKKKTAEFPLRAPQSWGRPLPATCHQVSRQKVTRRARDAETQDPASH